MTALARARRLTRASVCVALLLFVGISSAAAQSADAKPKVDIYGFAQADAIVDFNQNNPDWYDVNRPSRLPNVANQFGEDGRFYFGPRQSRFGVKGELPTSNGAVKAQFEFDMFGAGRDAGQTTIRLRHAWGQWKQVGARTHQQPVHGRRRVSERPRLLGTERHAVLPQRAAVLASRINNGRCRTRASRIEAPGASGDAGVLADRVELQNVKSRFPAPDITGHYRWGKKWGYIQLGGAFRYIGYDDVLPNDAFDLSGHVWGWGVSVSSNINLGSKDVLRLQVDPGRGRRELLQRRAGRRRPSRAIRVIR